MANLSCFITNLFLVLSLLGFHAQGRDVYWSCLESIGDKKEACLSQGVKYLAEAGCKIEKTIPEMKCFVKPNETPPGNNGSWECYIPTTNCQTWNSGCYGSKTTLKEIRLDRFNGKKICFSPLSDSEDPGFKVFRGTGALK